jgi:pimeloyl-ACP methyl ester carboxylesterase
MSQAEPLVLVPGLMCDHAVWAPLLPALEARRACQVVDHGLADALPAMAAQVLQVAPPRFALAGHSMGGRVALEVVRQAPQRVSRLALLDTGYKPLPPGAPGEEEARKRHALLDVARRDGVRAMAQQWVQGMVHPQRLGDAALIESIVAMMARRTAQHFEHQISALLARPDGSDVLASLGVPTLLLCGREDGWSPPAQHQAMADLVPAGLATLEVVEHCGHMGTMEQPRALGEALARWLAGPGKP